MRLELAHVLLHETVLYVAVPVDLLQVLEHVVEPAFVEEVADHPKRLLSLLPRHLVRQEKAEEAGDEIKALGVSDRRVGQT